MTIHKWQEIKDKFLSPDKHNQIAAEIKQELLKIGEGVWRQNDHLHLCQQALAKIACWNTALEYTKEPKSAAIAREALEAMGLKPEFG